MRVSHMSGTVLRVPLKVQVGAVVALLVAALASLWSTSASVIGREHRRASAKGLLDRAGDALADRGREVLAGAPRWPDYLDPADWEKLDRALTAESGAALRRFEGVE